MDIQQQRIAISEACGWMDIQRCTRRLNPNSNGVRIRGTKDKPSANYGREYAYLPDYLNDLNEWQPIERNLSQEDREVHQIILIDLSGCPFEAIHATASMRAEAFLKTLNLWTD